jgi:hypothetical protein
MRKRRRKSFLDEVLDIFAPPKRARRSSRVSMPKATRGMTHSSGKKTMGGTQMKARNTWKNIT